MAIRMVPRLSRRRLLQTARLLSRCAWWIDRRGRRIAEANLQVVYPKRSLAELKPIIRESYHYQTRSALDLMWAPQHLCRDTLFDHIQFRYEDEDAIARLKEGPVIWVTPHYGTFEWLSTAWGLIHKIKPMIVAEDFRNPALTPLFTKLRGFSGNPIISSERAMVRLLKHVKRGGQTAFLTDLRVKPSKAATIIRCFGFDTSVTILHAFLAQQTGAPIVPVICLPQDDGRYVFHFHHPLHATREDHPQGVAQQCWDVFEETIRGKPAPWLWMYKHWRYLPSAPDRAYPSYATRSKRFDALEASHASPS